jgi:MFS family permease
MVPSGSIIRNSNFQALIASRFLSDLALQALLFGVLIASVQNGGDEMEAAIIGVGFLLPGVLLGLVGGAVADALPKGFALVVAYLLMGVLCFSVPLALDFELRGMIAVLFTVRVLQQVSQPSEASAVPLVATHSELASANSVLSLASSTGEVVGKALMAPLLVTAFGIEPVVIIAGLLFILSATRALRFRVEPGALSSEGDADAEEELEATRAEQVHMTSTRQAMRWLIDEPAAFWMLMLAAMASTTGVVLGVLGPQYVTVVLDVPAENTLYVFAPAAGGLLAALLTVPLLIKIFKERLVAALGFVIVAVGLAGLGMIDTATEVLADRVLIVDIPGVGEQVEMAAAISFLLGLGMTYAGAATQTYIGKYVHSEVHGRVFALLGTMMDGLSIPALLLMGAAAGLIGVANVMLISPLVLIVLAFAVNGYLGRWRTPEPVDGPVIDRVRSPRNDRGITSRATGSASQEGARRRMSRLCGD